MTDLVLDAPDVVEPAVDLVEDAPEIPPRLSVYDVMLPGETKWQTVRRIRDEIERARLTAEHGSRFNQARHAVEQSLADVGKK